MERHPERFHVPVPRMDRGDVYAYASTSERNNPDFAVTARRVHARSYLGEGFINDEAVDETGQVVSDIDKSRGDAVDYYLGFTAEGQPISTLRTIDAATMDGFEQLPAYTLTKDSLHQESAAFLLKAERQGRPIKEISSFGHVPEVSSAAGFELLRHALQESYGKDHVWFFAMVTENYQKLVYAFGPRAIRRAGDPVSLTDDRIGDVSLMPAIVDTTHFYDDVKEEITKEADARKRRRMLKYLQNFAAGLEPGALSESVESFLDDASASELVAYARSRQDVRTVAGEWTPPLQFNFSNPVDRLLAKQLIDNGQARSILDPQWQDEFPEFSRGALSEKDGSWVFFPWRSSLVHYPDAQTYRAMRQHRDRDLVTEEEQRTLHEARPLYAGLSVGSHVLEHMLYAGVGGSHILADFDSISVSNLNRIHAGMPEVGQQKIDVFAKMTSEVDPYIQQTLLRKGVTPESLDLLEEPPTIIFDEVDDFAAKALLRMYAKEHGVPLIMATDVGYKSVIDIERHDLRPTQPFNGRITQAAIEAMLEGRLTPEERMKITTKLIGLSNASFRLLQSLSNPNLKGLPQLEVTASQGGALATIVARDILLGRNVPSGRHVHDARRSMKLPAEMPLSEGMRALKNFAFKK